MPDRTDASQALLTVSKILYTVTDFVEALRQTCRELARFTGADTGAVHMIDRERGTLVPVAGYRIPKDFQEVLGATPLPLSEQGFSATVFGAGKIAWSDDIQSDPRFVYPLFRQFPHRSGVVIPLLVDHDVAGAFYLVWWEKRCRFEEEDIRILEGIAHQVALLLRNARLTRRLEERGVVATAAEASYRLLFDRNLAGIFRAGHDGTIIQCNDAFARMLGDRSAAETLGRNIIDVFCDPADRETMLRRPDPDGIVTSHEVRWRRSDSQPLWVLVNVRNIVEAGRACLEGIVIDITDLKRKQTAESLRPVPRPESS